MSDIPPPLPGIGSLDWGHDLNAYLLWLTDRPVTPVVGNMSTYLYVFNNSAPPPNNGQVRLDNSDQTLAMHAYIRTVTSDGIDLTNLMAQITDTSRLYLQAKGDATAWQSYSILGPGVDAGGYFDFAVQHSDGGSPLPSQGQGSPCLLAFTAAQIQLGGSS